MHYEYFGGKGREGVEKDKVKETEEEGESTKKREEGRTGTGERMDISAKERDKMKETKEEGEASQEGEKGGPGTGERMDRSTKDKGNTEQQATQTGNEFTGVDASQAGGDIGKQTTQLHIGTLNMSGISYGYRGKYIKTEEDLLKIRPGEKLREVTKMMKTQGISLMTLLDTLGHAPGYGRYEGGANISTTARKEMSEEAVLSARRRAGIYYI
eukprot:6194971-Pleurochrysis_carterae.AAC.3